MENAVALQKSPSRELRVELRMLASAPDNTVYWRIGDDGGGPPDREMAFRSMLLSRSLARPIALSLRSPLSARCCSASLFPREKRAFFGTKETDKKEGERDVARERKSGNWEDGTQLHLAVVYCNGAAWVVRVQQLPPCRPIYGV